MRTTIDINDRLWEGVTSITGITIKKRAIETVFKEYLRMKRRESLSNLVGNYKDFGLEQRDLRKMRDEN